MATELDRSWWSSLQVLIRALAVRTSGQRLRTSQSRWVGSCSSWKGSSGEELVVEAEACIGRQMRGGREAFTVLWLLRSY